MALHVGSLLAGRYEITAPIATGGMGEVWRATDRTLGRTVAAKVLKSEYTGDRNFLERFRNEARHTAGLAHQNIASVYDYGEISDVDGRPLAFLVMEYVEGEPLVAILDRDLTLTPERTLDVLAQAGDGLSAAHRAGVVHRDIKPGNLMVRPDGVVKLTDFGIAWARDAAPLTRTGMVVGTAQYLSPEQAQGFQVTAASDVYSLGILAYECLAGNRPFDGESQVAIALAQINRPPPPLPSTIPAPVRALVDKALAKDPAARFPDGGALADAARQVAAGGPGPETSATTAFIPAVGGDGTQVIGAAGAAAMAGAALGAAGVAAAKGPATAPRTMPPLQAGPVDDDVDDWDDDAPRRRSPWPWVAAAAVVLLVLGAVLAFTLLGGGDDGEPASPGTTTTTPATSTSAPATTTGPSTTAEESSAEETTGAEEEPTEEPGEQTTEAPPAVTTTAPRPTTTTATTMSQPPATTTTPSTASETTTVAPGQPDAGATT